MNTRYAYSGYNDYAVNNMYYTLAMVALREYVAQIFEPDQTQVQGSCLSAQCRCLLSWTRLYVTDDVAALKEFQDNHRF
jgi:hypothetical protein